MKLKSEGKRIWALPALTASIFLITVAVVITFSTRTSNAISNLGLVSFPFLDGVTQFSSRLDTLIGVFQGAVAEGDIKRLEEASLQIEHMDKLLDKMAALPGKEPQVESLRFAFTHYHQLATQTALILLNREAGQLEAAVPGMQRALSNLQSHVQMVQNDARQEFEDRLEFSRRGVRSVLVAILVSASAVIAVLLVARQLQRAVHQLNAEIVERQAVEESLREGEERYRLLIEISPDAIILESEGVIGFVNQSALRLFGASDPRQLIGRLLMDLVAEPWQELIKNRMDAFMHERGEARTLEARILRLDGREIDVEITNSIFQYKGMQAVQTIIHDISKHKHYEEQLRHQALHDSLTGLPNRNFLMEYLERRIAQAERVQESFYVLFIDVDRFKLINDSLGHNLGDQLLKTLAERMLKCIRATDVLARLGGDEFVVLLGNGMADEALPRTVERILSAVTQKIVLKDHALSVTCSIGCSAFPQDGTDAITLLQHADTAMYQAKAEGRNNIQHYVSDMHIRVNEQLVMEARLRQGLEREEFMLYYQPQINLHTGEIIGVEALLRWRSPETGFILPLKFIPMAEETGLIIPLGEWALREACRQAKAWLDEGLPPIRMSVNLSVQQLLQPAFAAEVQRVLDASQLPPEFLELEITETVSMKDPEKMIALLAQFRQIGVNLAIDDFGTGYSNLIYLKRFPIQKLKLDRAFLLDLVAGSVDLAIVEGFIRIAHSLQIEVLAEGVEELGQLLLLQRSGCDAMQGYFFSQPLPADECTAMLRRRERLQLHVAA